MTEDCVLTLTIIFQNFTFITSGYGESERGFLCVAVKISILREVILFKVH